MICDDNFRKAGMNFMKYSSKILDTHKMCDESQNLITLRQWIHQTMKYTFMPDVSDETLDKMKDEDLNILVKTLSIF